MWEVKQSEWDISSAVRSEYHTDSSWEGLFLNGVALQTPCRSENWNTKWNNLAKTEPTERNSRVGAVMMFGRGECNNHMLCTHIFFSHQVDRDMSSSPIKGVSVTLEDRSTPYVLLFTHLPPAKMETQPVTEHNKQGLQHTYAKLLGTCLLVARVSLNFWLISWHSKQHFHRLQTWGQKFKMRSESVHLHLQNKTSGLSQNNYLNAEIQIFQNRSTESNSRVVSVVPFGSGEFNNHHVCCALTFSFVIKWIETVHPIVGVSATLGGSTHHIRTHHICQNGNATAEHKKSFAA